MADGETESEKSDSVSEESDYGELIESDNSDSDLYPIHEVRAWRFEPPGRQNKENERGNRNETPATESEEDRLVDSDDWCTCGNCQVMRTQEECRCCQEIGEVRAKLLSAVEDVEGLQEPPSCITAHPGFLAVCTNRWVLETAWFQYKQQYGSKAYEGAPHKKNRHIAYRQMARWCWGVWERI